MKKHLFGLLAVVLAIGFSAFSPRFATVYFEYVAPGGSYSNTNVETKANWIRVDFEAIICEENDLQKACTLGVSDAVLQFPTQTTLDDADGIHNLEIVADAGATAAVTDVKKGVNSVSPLKYNSLE